MPGKRAVLPRPRVIDMMMAQINGGTHFDERELNRIGHLDRARADATIELFKGTFSNPIMKNGVWVDAESMDDEVKKSITVGTGLTMYDLRAPALNLFPTVTPLRNSIPREQRATPGDALHYKAVLATIGSGVPNMGWVPEGRRAGSMSYNTTSVTVPYVTIGEEDSITEEARFAAMGFEDEDALLQLRLLLRMFIKEEVGLLGGDSSYPLGTPGTITAAAAGSGATLPALTYGVRVAALTQEGYANATMTTAGCLTQVTVQGNDAQTFTLNGGVSALSAEATQAVTSGQTLSVSVPVVPGAVAYAWYVGGVGAERLEAITTINSAVFNKPLLGNLQAASAITGDFSVNSTLAFDGLITVGFKNANIAAPNTNAYAATMATGTAGTGTPITADGVGGIVEVMTMLVAMWNNWKISPTVAYVNAQELQNIAKKVLSTASAPLLRYNTSADDAALPEYKVTASGVIAFYFNPFTADGGMKVPIKIHPNLAPGTMLWYAEHLPPWYVSNNTPEVAVVQTRQDYYAEVWPKTTRTQFYGIYSQETLAVFAPFGIGLITNIANG